MVMEWIVSVNDNNNENNVNNNVNINTHQPVIEIPCILSSLNLSEQNSENCEDIEGADELSDSPKPQSVDLEEKRKSIDSAMRSNQNHDELEKYKKRVKERIIGRQNEKK